MKTFTLLAALALAVPAQADDLKAKSEPLSTSDALVVAKLHHGNQEEIEMASFALAHGTKVVAPYARTILRDHTAGDKELTALARRHRLSPIPKPDDADANEMDAMSHLKNLSGARLDREYIDMMVIDHRDDLSMVDTALAQVADPDLHALLVTTRPVLQRHFDTAKNLQTPTPQARR